MTFSQKLMWNNADNYILHLEGFPIKRVSSFDEFYNEIKDSLYIHICTLPEDLHVDNIKYSELILPNSITEEVKQRIESSFSDVSLQARNSFWTILIQHLWEFCHSTFNEIKYERRFKDPELGKFFKLLEEAKKNGLFDGKGFSE
ncbi:MAG: hypothetical protein ACK41Z_04275 [Sediminibacterium sp.]